MGDIGLPVEPIHIELPEPARAPVTEPVAPHPEKVLA